MPIPQNGQTHSNSLILQETMSTRKKKSEQQRQRRYHKRPQVVVNEFPENLDAFKKPNVVPGNSTTKMRELLQ